MAVSLLTMNGSTYVIALRISDSYSCSLSDSTRNRVGTALSAVPAIALGVAVALVIALASVITGTR